MAMAWPMQCTVREALIHSPDARASWQMQARNGDGESTTSGLPMQSSPSVPECAVRNMLTRRDRFAADIEAIAPCCGLDVHDTFRSTGCFAGLGHGREAGPASLSVAGRPGR